MDDISKNKESDEIEYLSNCDLCGCGDIIYAGTGGNIYKCNRCGYIFDNPRPTFSAIKKYYSQINRYDSWLKEEKGRDILWQKRLAMVKRYKKRGFLLDVGAGIGQFLFFAQKYFQVYGTEISESAIKIAKEKYNLNLIKGALEDIDLGSQRFDIITLFHILEHVPSPAHLIERCQNLLSEGGIIIIAVPNEIDSREYRNYRFPKIKLDGSMDEIHVSHFTAASLKGLLLKNSFSIIDDTLDPYYPTIGKRRYIDDLKYFCCLLFKKIFKVNIYNCIWIAAKRKAMPFLL